VWNHSDAGGGPGQAAGIRLRLDNGISGYIHIRNLSDKRVSNPEERVATRVRTFIDVSPGLMWSGFLWNVHQKVQTLLTKIVSGGKQISPLILF
jgi:hypothetical protein